MPKNKAILVVLSVFLVFSFFTSTALPQESKNSEGTKCLKGVEFLSGFGLAKLEAKGDYKVIPLFVGFDFDFKPITKKVGINPPSLIQFVLEPFVSCVFEPDSNAEIGNNFLFKIGIFPESWKFQPYFKGGVGVIYLTQHTREQSTQFNFNEYVGGGINYFFQKDTALTVEYRYRHVSNAGIKHPNSGIDTNFVLCGISKNF